MPSALTAASLNLVSIVLIYIVLLWGLDYGASGLLLCITALSILNYSYDLSQLRRAKSPMLATHNFIYESYSGRELKMVGTRKGQRAVITELNPPNMDQLDCIFIFA